MNQASPSQFLGTQAVTLDEKSRVTIPSKWREKLRAQELFVTPSTTERCLVLMPQETLDAIIVRVRQNPGLSEEEKQRVVARLTRKTDPMNVDKAGRVTMKQESLQSVGILKEAVITGDGDRMKLWSPEEYKDDDGADDILRRHASIIGL